MWQPRLWPDEVQFGLAASTTSQPHNLSLKKIKQHSRRQEAARRSRAFVGHPRGERDPGDGVVA
jgi:hypothetical protein